MGKYCDPALLDLALDDIKAKGDRLTVCDGQPADFADVAARAKGFVALTGTDYGGPEDAASGRKLAVLEQTGLSIATAGMCDHVALTDQVNSRLLYVTTISNPQTAAVGNTVDVAQWEINLQDPV